MAVMYMTVGVAFGGETATQFPQLSVLRVVLLNLDENEVKRYVVSTKPIL